MLAWAALLGALFLDWVQHKRHRPTLCSTARRFIPWQWFVALWAGLTAWIVRHYWRGFKIQLDNLTD